MLSFMYRVKFSTCNELGGLKIKVTIWNRHHYHYRRRCHRTLIEHQPDGLIIGFMGLIGRRPVRKKRNTTMGKNQELFMIQTKKFNSIL